MGSWDKAGRAASLLSLSQVTAGAAQLKIYLHKLRILARALARWRKKRKKLRALSSLPSLRMHGSGIRSLVLLLITHFSRAESFFFAFIFGRESLFPCFQVFS